MPRRPAQPVPVVHLRLSTGEIVEVDFRWSPQRWTSALAEAVLRGRLTQDTEGRAETIEDALAEEVRYILATTRAEIKDILLAHLIASAVERRLRRLIPEAQAAQAAAESGATPTS